VSEAEMLENNDNAGLLHSHKRKILFFLVFLCFGAIIYIVLGSVKSESCVFSPARYLESSKEIVELQTKVDEKLKVVSMPEVEIEGHSGAYPHKLLAYQALSAQRIVETICEIGFNAGHSSITWLVANPKAHLYSFDLPHSYQEIGVSLINELFPGRLTVTNGNSTETIPQFFANNPTIMCDIAHVDGGHDYVTALADLNNLGSRVKAGGILLIDDTLCPGKPWCVGPQMAWDEYVKKHAGNLSPSIYGYDPKNLSGFQGAWVLLPLSP